MKPAVKEALCAALDGGKYKQGRSYLKKIDRNGVTRHCCLGVLTELYIAEKKPVEAWNKPLKCADDLRVRVYGYGRYGKNDMPTETILKWAGLEHGEAQALAGMNDIGQTFRTISTYIKENL